MSNNPNNNENKNSLPQYDKNDIEKCINGFKFIMENINDIPKLTNEIIDLSYNGEIGLKYIRPTSWKILLDIFPKEKNSTIKDWLNQTKENRKTYKKKLKELTSLNKFSGDPLGGCSQKEGWNSFFEDSETKRIIKLDVNRTYQDKDLFCNEKIKEIECNILTIWARENKIPGYKQGINEILAMLLYSFYPYYIKSNIKKYSDDYLNNLILEPEKNYKELYYYFHDENYLESDLFSLLTKIMNYGVKKFFLDIDKKNNPNETITYLNKRCNNIVHKDLRLQDNRLYNHFVNIELDCEFVIQRWLKCLFDREFHPKHVEIFWDALLADENQVKSFDFNLADFICVAMIIFLRDELVIKDQNESFQRLFKYPPIESPVPLISLAINIRNEIKVKEFEEEEKKKEQEKKKEKMKIKIQEIDKINQDLIKKKNMNPIDSLDYLAEKKSKYSGVSVENNLNKNERNIINDGNPRIKIEELSLQNKYMLKELRRMFIKYNNKMDKSDRQKVNTLFDTIEKNI